MASDALMAPAASAPIVRQIRGFVEWVGAGRPLTQTGRVRLADALALVDLLDTGDVLDPRFPTRSSSELPRLSLLVGWAKAARLVRVVRGRLVVVNKRIELLDRPPELAAQMLEGLSRLGDELGHSVVMADAGHTAEAVLAELVGQGGTLPCARACDIAWASAMSRYTFPGASEQQLGWARRHGDRDLLWMLEAIAGLGVVRVADDTITLTALGERSVSAWLGLGSPSSPVLCVKVTLQQSEDPVVWRRLRVPADIRLDRFHQVLTAAVGWQDYHLHVFECGAERYGPVMPDLDIQDERQITLDGLLAAEGDRLDYEYDFGDRWCHDIVLEQVLPSDDGACPRCTDGAGRCPPEDVGGIWGYEELRRVMADPGDDEHIAMLEWLGLSDARDFDASAFDLDRVNDAVAGVLAGRVV